MKDIIFHTVIKMPIFAIVTFIFIIFRIFPPKKINSLYGYRTKRSMKNQESWDLAQKSSSKISLILTAIIFAVQISSSLLLNEKRYLDLVLLILWFIGLLGMFIYVEKKLKSLN